MLTRKKSPPLWPPMFQILFHILALTLIANNAAAERLLILEIDAPAGRQSTADIMAEMIRNEAKENLEQKGFDVVYEGDTNKRPIQSQYVISGQLLKDDGEWLLRLKLIRSQTDKILKGTVLIRQRISQLRHALPKETRKLIGPLSKSLSGQKSTRKTRQRNPRIMPNTKPDIEFVKKPSSKQPSTKAKGKDEKKSVSEKPSPTAPNPGLPDVIIKSILTKNKDITRCFLKERNNNGKIPSAAPLRFVVNPTGYVMGMKIYKGKYIGSSFEQCLKSALKKIQFPPFEGKDQEIQYVLRPG